MPRIVPSQVVDVIDSLFPNAKDEREGSVPELRWDDATRLLAILELTARIPEELLILNSTQYAEYVASLAAIRWYVERWQGSERVTPPYSQPLTAIPGLRRHSSVALIRQALAACPDDVPSIGMFELAFITVPGLRDNLRLDISAINAALGNGEWKAATVLAGSVVEALLLWGLQQKPEPEVTTGIGKVGRKLDSNNMLKWDLADYIDVSEVLGILKADTVAQCQIARGFRNLIHPGRAERLAQACNHGTALSAVAAVEHVITDLSS